MTLTFAPATREQSYDIPAWVYEHRLLSRVYVDDNGCWIWQGSTMRTGYGEIRAWRSHWLTHRLAYTVMIGPIQPDMQIDHLCRVRACLNPHHLEQVTQAENLRRQGAAVTHCPRGHEYTEENTYRCRRGLRRCRECGRLRNREAKRANRRAS